MAKTHPNQGKAWTAAQNRELRSQVASNTPTRVIAFKQGRSVASIYSHASELGLSLRPTNQSPYGTAGRPRR